MLKEGLKKFTGILILVLMILGWISHTVWGRSHVRIGSLPKVVRQGEIDLISLFGPSSLESVFTEFQGRRFPLVFNEQKGIYEGLIGIDLETPAHLHEIKVVAIENRLPIFSATFPLRVEKIDFGVQRLSLPPKMVELDRETLERVHQEAKLLDTLFQVLREERLWRGDFIRPVEGELSLAFGVNRIINGQHRSPHTGVDIKAEEGTPVLACNSGLVVLVKELYFAGKSVIIDHGLGIFSMYFHLSAVQVKEGDRMNKGVVLGQVGSTGRSTGPHLHWGIRVNGAKVDPFSLLKLSF